MSRAKEKIIKDYLSRIGQKGGRVSRRKLDADTARKMVQLREAKRAFKTYYAECFWSFDPQLKLTLRDVTWVGEQLMKHGSRKCWLIGKRLCL